MPGSLSTGSEVGRWSRLARAAQLRSLAGCTAVGVLAGVAMAHARLHLGMPGHKALFWMIPILVARLLYRHRVGATAGACAAAGASLALGGNLAGGVLFVPLVALAGGLLDAAAAWGERRALPVAMRIGLMGAAGAAANVLCAAKRLLTPQLNAHALLGLRGLPAQLLSYALFGLLAGLTAAAVAAAATAARRARRRGSPARPD